MTGLPTGFLEMATIHGPYLTHDMGPSIKDGTLLHNRERTAEASGRNRTVTFHGLLRQETEEEGLPHLMSRQLPTNMRTQIRPKYISRTNPGSQMSHDMGLFWVIYKHPGFG